MFHLVFTICVLFCHTWICAQGQEALLMLPGGLLYAESQGTIEACVVLSEQPVSDVMVNLTTMDGTAQIGLDYDLPTLTITVPANETMGCGNITITDDSLVEEDESFTVCTSLSDCTNVTINDNDGASVSLVEPTSFSVTEGDNSAVVPFCVQLDDVAGGLERDIPLSISVGGSAGSGDYQTNLNPTIPSSTAEGDSVCIDITIVGDDIVEGEESLILNVSVANTNDVIDGGDIVTVTIEDNDAVEAELMLPGGLLYAESQGTIQACVALNNTTVREIDVTVNLTTVDGTTQAPADYESVAESFVFTPTSATTMCVDITIINDGFSEGVETLSILLSSDSVSLGRNAQVFLRDPGGFSSVIIGLEESTYSVDEGAGRAEVCAVLPAGPAGRRVEADILVQDLPPGQGVSASDGADYIAPFLGFVIIPPAIRQCRFFTILNDVLVEADESLIITLDSLDAVPVTGDSARLTIIDNDGAIVSLSVSTPTSFTVQEGDAGNNTDVEFCVQLDDDAGGLERDINLFVVVLNPNIVGSAESGDYQTNQFLTIPSTTAMGNTVCHQIIIVGDDLVEGDETLTLAIRVVDTNDVINGGDIITVAILDNDGATISLETTSTITVTEGNEGMTTPIEISILLLDAMDGLERSVEFSLSAANDTAVVGDYNQFNQIISTITPGTTASNSTGIRFMIPGIIIGDNVLEADETFSISITMENPLDTIAEPSNITITILNDDTSSALFQLLLTGDITCKDWVEVNEEEKLNIIIAQVSAEIESLCGCGFEMDSIEAGQFDCSDEPNDVTFRAKINGDVNELAPELIEYIEMRVNSTVVIEVQGVNFTLSTTCPVEIESFDEGLCEPEPPTIVTEGVSSGGDDDDAGLIAGVIVGVLAAIIILAILIVVVIYFITREHKRKSWDPTREAHFVMARPGAAEDPPSDDWTEEREEAEHRAGDPPKVDVGASLPEYEQLYKPTS